MTANLEETDMNVTLSRAYAGICESAAVAAWAVKSAAAVLGVDIRRASRSARWLKQLPKHEN